MYKQTKDYGDKVPYDPSHLCVENVVCIYRGKVRTCMCGCAGNYVYNPLHRDFVEADIGKVDAGNAEFDLAKIKRAISEIKRKGAYTSVGHGNEFCYADGSTRQLTIYLRIPYSNHWIQKAGERVKQYGTGGWD